MKEKIEEIVMMVGSIFPGNTNSVAEFNIYNDPHVAAIVFQSGVKINMSGISRHLAKIFETGELDEKVVVAKIATTTKHGAIQDKTQTTPTLAFRRYDIFNVIFYAFVLAVSAFFFQFPLL